MPSSVRLAYFQLRWPTKWVKVVTLSAYSRKRGAYETYETQLSRGRSALVMVSFSSFEYLAGRGAGGRGSEVEAWTVAAEVQV